MSAKQYREAFEEAIYNKYKEAEMNKYRQGNVEEYRLISKQDFFRMKGDGTYVLEPINFSYSGWNEAIRYILSTPIDESVKAVEHILDVNDI